MKLNLIEADDVTDVTLQGYAIWVSLETDTEYQTTGLSVIRDTLQNNTSH